MKTKTALIAIILVVIGGLLSQSAGAAGRQYNQIAEPQQVDPRKQQLQEQARMAAQKMDEILRNIYNAVNQLEEPAADQIEFADQLLEASRRCMTEFDDNDKGKYFLLQAWIDYQKGDLSGAVMNSGRACRLGDGSTDAWVSHQYFSVLGNQRPFRPRPPRRTNDFNNGRNGGIDAGMTGQSLYGMGGTLDFDPDSLRHDVLGRTLTAFRTQDLSGRTFSYEPGKEVLCVLVWQLETQPVQVQTTAAPVDPLTNLLQRDIPGQGTDNAGMAGPNPVNQQADTLQALQARISDREKVRFLSLNINSDMNRQEVVKFSLENQRSWPQLLAVENDALRDLRVSAEEPFAVVVDKQGNVKFAGSPEGFMLPMLLKKTAEVEFRAQAAPNMDYMRGREMLVGRMPRIVDPNLPPADPNSPIPAPADPNLPFRPAPTPRPTINPAAQAQGAPGVQEREYRQLPLEEESQAEKIMAYTRGLFMPAGGRRITTYANGVKFCRQLIRDYPGTVYEEEARGFLRTIPENQRAQYNITDEELGVK